MPAEEGEGNLSGLISGFDGLVEINPVWKNLNDRYMKRDGVFSDPHGNRQHIAGRIRAASVTGNRFVRDRVGENMQQNQHIGLGDVGQIFQRNRIVRKTGGKIHRNGFDSPNGFQVSDQRFFEQPIFRTVQRPDQDTDFLGVRQPYRRVDRIVEHDFGCRTSGQKKREENKKNP
jgi:hypothetical protein